MRVFQARAYDTAGSDSVNIRECADCTFAWQFPIGRSVEQSIQYFDVAYAGGGRSRSTYFSADRKAGIASLEFEFVSSLPVRERTLLDIGAGAGFFAGLAAEHGWLVTAVDPALEIDRVAAFQRVTAIRGTTEQVPKGAVFDVVTLWDVIEHATDPLEMLQDAQRFLRPGGWLVLETGNYKSAARVMAGRAHWMFQLDHRWYFSPESLELLLSESGFSKFVHCDRVLRPGWRGTCEYRGPLFRQLCGSAIRKPWQVLSHIAKHRELTNAKRWKSAGIEIFALAASIA